jgi:zona occludens toxin (predicted ATPase)
MNISRSMRLLVLIPFLAACGAADAHAPCTDSEVREAAMRNLGAALVASTTGDPTMEAVVHDDRYVVHIPRQYRRAVGMDSISVAYTVNRSAELELEWPADLGIPDIKFALGSAVKVSTYSGGQNVVSCAGEVVVSQQGEVGENIPLTFSVQTMDDGSVSVFGQFMETTFGRPAASG